MPWREGWSDRSQERDFPLCLRKPTFQGCVGPPYPKRLRCEHFTWTPNQPPPGSLEPRRPGHEGKSYWRLGGAPGEGWHPCFQAGPPPLPGLPGSSWAQKEPQQVCQHRAPSHRPESPHASGALSFRQNGRSRAGAGTGRPQQAELTGAGGQRRCQAREAAAGNGKERQAGRWGLAAERTVVGRPGG